MNDTKKPNLLHFFYAGLLVLLLMLAGVNNYFKVMPEKVSIALVSLAIAVVLFGILDSVVKFTIGEESKLGKAGSLGGAAAGFYMVFQLMIQTPDPQKQEVIFDLEFTAPLNRSPAIEHFDAERLLIHQKIPASTYRDHPIVPSRFIGSSIGHYELKERRVKQVGDRYEARVKRQVLSSFVGQLNDIPHFDLCFTYSAEGPIEATFECNMTECTIGQLSKNIEACQAQHAVTAWQLISKAYAIQTASGWITPSLDTLKENYQSNHNTYVEFTVVADDLKLPENTDAYSYQLTVNGHPVFINGWTEAETLSAFDPKQPFKFHFGLQNLDFSGADLGQENLQLTLTFYAAGQKARTDIINRNYVALRTVHTISDVVNDVLYHWSGHQFFAQNDGFEVFFWSSTSADEIVNRRKKFFDEANLQYQDAKVVAVVRPPLLQNPNYGLVLGLVDDSGRIDFTFSQTTATEIAGWLRSEVAPLRTAVRQETGQQHPLIRDVNIYQIGH